MCQDLAAERTPTMFKKALESMASTAASMPRPNLKSKVSMPSTAELAATSAECRGAANNGTGANNEKAHRTCTDLDQNQKNNLVVPCEPVHTRHYKN